MQRITQVSEVIPSLTFERCKVPPGYFLGGVAKRVERQIVDIVFHGETKTVKNIPSSPIMAYLLSHATLDSKAPCNSLS